MHPKRRHLLASALVVLPTFVAASPLPVLPWATSSFSFELPAGRVEFRMECPDGALTKLSAIRGKRVVELPIAQLGVLPLSKTCAGASTSAELEEEGSPNITGIGLKIQMSHEYINVGKILVRRRQLRKDAVLEAQCPGGGLAQRYCKVY